MHRLATFLYALSFAPSHFWEIACILLGISFIGLVLYARAKHLAAKDLFENIVSKIRAGITKLDASAVDRIHALENGGHLAAGSTQKLVAAQTAYYAPNGSPAEAAPKS